MLFLKLFHESVLMALHALYTNKLRTFLSLLGITIGIFAIISVFTVVDALESSVRNSIASLGSNVIYVEKWPWIFDSDYPWWKYFNRPQPNVREMERLNERSETAAAISYLVSVGNKTVKRRNNSVENAEIQGVSHDFNKVKALEFSDGRYFTEQESRAGRSVAIVGADIAENLFPGENAVGKQITGGNRKVTVVGILKKEGESILESSSDKQILLPVQFVRNLIDLKSMFVWQSIMVKAKPGIPNKEVKYEIKGIMRSLRKLRPKEEDDFALNESSLISAQVDSIFSMISMAGMVIGGFSILVGGFGIANIMFVSVKERTSMIGIQKSLGAKNYFILLQFLIESVVLCVVGGGIGLIVVYLGTQIAGSMADMDLPLTIRNIFVGISLSAGIGIISGLIPAWVASRMDPVEAIRAN